MNPDTRQRASVALARGGRRPNENLGFMPVRGFVLQASAVIDGHVMRIKTYT
jgi:hypothetical protein